MPNFRAAREQRMVGNETVPVVWSVLTTRGHLGAVGASSLKVGEESADGLGVVPKHTKCLFGGRCR